MEYLTEIMNSATKPGGLVALGCLLLIFSVLLGVILFDGTQRLNKSTPINSLAKSPMSVGILTLILLMLFLSFTLLSAQSLSDIGQSRSTPTATPTLTPTPTPG